MNTRQKPLRILYALQGTGNGHTARALELIPLLRRLGPYEVEVWISGTQSELTLPFGVQKSWKGLTFYYGKKGGLHVLRTIRKNAFIRFLWDVWRCPISDYDFVLNDFEPVSAWAGRLRGIPVLAISHQAAVVHPLSPRPAKQKPLIEKAMFWLAPYQACVGFHFKSFGPGIFPPVIREEIRTLVQTPKDQVLVYLPAFSPEKLLPLLTALDYPVHAYFKGAIEPQRIEKVWIRPIDTSHFLDSFQSSNSVLCGAGFELPSEALFHGKRLAVVPIKSHYEQACNAAAAVQCGAWRFSKLKKKHGKTLLKWLHSPPPRPLYCPNVSEEILARILMHFEVHGSFTTFGTETETDPLYAPAA
jgi:uncharacterized protein (TIGR00661 family)